ncbi:serine/threonine-protein kinase PknB [mine drainage metagenome]|uniref:Serine/threonine-protein kinase PknB n=1 Tax=mine drainage metagenome TaxID=410659 RepID=A0A1J5QNK7_9ZZZZ
MAATISRFEIIRELGHGAQGTVYLAQDVHLDRQVALKTLHSKEGDMAALLKEARIVSKLQHPNIVTLFDAGEHEGEPYLVYSFVEGRTLAQLLKAEGTLPLTRAVQITCGILDGIAHAHQQGIMHLDLKPANVMISSSGQALVMDFGIARTITQKSARTNTLDGSPQYIAPEIVLGRNPSPSSDLFSVGMMLYEMVTGAPAVAGDDIVEIMQRNAREAAESPSVRNIHVDERLEAIILKSIAKIPEQRYLNAGAMRQALLEYLDPTQGELPHVEGEGHSTLEFLLRRMRSKSDFPALSSTISEINKVVDSESENANKLTKSILQDFALTNKLLKLVNTVSYGQFGGKINTISKAVVVLGFETVRNVAMTLILMEFLQNKAQAAQIKDDVVSSFFAGIVAAQLSAGRSIKDAEEAMICSMFRNLGRLLATFYFFEESQEISSLIEQGESESRAALKVLGVTYNDLGISIAKNWNFPDRLIAGMQKLSGEKIKKPHGELEMLSVTVNLASELCAVADTSEAAEKSAALRKLSKRYEDATKVSEQQLSQAIEKGLDELSTRAGIFGLDLTRSSFLKRVNTWSGARTEAGHAEEPDSMAGITQLGMELETSSDPSGEPARIDPETVLSAGIQDVTNTLVEEHHLNDLLQMVLESMHRGMSFNRTLIFVRDAKKNQMTARFGFGHDSDEILARFHFPLAFTPDVFHLAMEKGADIVIEDVTSSNIASKIPAWYHDTVDSKCFLLLPIMIKGKAIGLIYADMQKANSLQITPRQLSLLRTLRNQAVLAIKQKQ